MSRKAVKSQLELYMEEVEGEEGGVSVFEQVHFQQPKPSASRIGFLNAWLPELLAGCIQDAEAAYYMLSSSAIEITLLANPADEKRTPCYTLERRILLLLSCIAYVVYQPFSNQAENGSIGVSIYHELIRMVDSAIFWLLLCTAVFPIAIGVLLWILQRKYHRKRSTCKRATECILGVIRRVQLVHMGGSISHPLPPVAKLEERLLHMHQRDSGAIATNQDNMMSCIEMRKELGNALLVVLKQHVHVLRCDELSQEREELHRLCAQYEREWAHSTPTLSQLDVMAQAAFSGETSAMMDKYIAVQLREAVHTSYAVNTTCNRTQSSTSTDVQFVLDNVYRCLVHCITGTHQLLQLPVLICTLVLQLDKFTSKCISISGQVINVSTIAAGDPAVHETGSTGSSFADQYLSARLQLAKLRGAYEEVGVRLWLAEQALSNPAALQYLLPDQNLLGPSAAMQESNNHYMSEQTLQCLYAAMSSLSGTLCSGGPAAAGAGELLQNVEVMLSSLPTQRDFETLCGSLLCLAAATERGITPEQLRQALNSNSTTINESINVSTETGLTSDETTLALNAHSQNAVQNFFEGGETAPVCIGNVRKHGDDNASDDVNIIDIFTTIIPAKTVLSGRKNAAADQVDEAAAQRERAHAQLLLRELGQHMRRRQSTSQVGGSGTGSSGGYTLERVRQIVADDADVSTAGVRIETQIQAVDNSLQALQDDATEHVQEGTAVTSESALGAGDQVMHRVGTLLLSTEELRSLQQPRTNRIVPLSTGTGNDADATPILVVQDCDRQAIFSEMFKLNRGGAVGGSAFGAALQGRRQEDAFGDDLSD